MSSLMPWFNHHSKTYYNVLCVGSPTVVASTADSNSCNIDGDVKDIKIITGLHLALFLLCLLGAVLFLLFLKVCVSTILFKFILFIFIIIHGLFFFCQLH